MKFSICIPTYNRAGFLPECLDSVLQQTHFDYEIVITDNQSTDDTQKLISTYSDPRIKYFLNERNVGLWGNHNEAIMKSGCEWIVFLHTDEVLLPNALELLAAKVNEAGNNPVDAIFSNGDMPAFAEVKKQPFYSPFLSFPYTLLSSITGLGNPSGVCFRKDALMRVGCFETKGKVSYIADHHLYSKLANAGCTFGFVDASLKIAKEGPHQGTADVTSTHAYTGVKSLMTFVVGSTNYEQVVLAFNQTDCKWSRQTINKFYFFLSTSSTQKNKWALLAKYLSSFRAPFGFQNTSIIGNFLFGPAFYSRVIGSKKFFGIK